MWPRKQHPFFFLYFLVFQICGVLHVQQKYSSRYHTDKAFPNAQSFHIHTLNITSKNKYKCCNPHYYDLKERWVRRKSFSSLCKKRTTKNYWRTFFKMCCSKYNHFCQRENGHCTLTKNGPEVCTPISSTQTVLLCVPDCFPFVHAAQMRATKLAPHNPTTHPAPIRNT